MYVDDVEQSTPSLKRLIGDDLIVLEDSTHFMRRYLATIPDGHPLKGLFRYCAVRSCMLGILGLALHISDDTA